MARKKNHDAPHEDHADETWLIPYSDLLTLLLALFIVLFATSSLDKKKAAQLEYALAAAFNSVPPEPVNGKLVEFMDEAGGLDLGKDVGLGSDSQGAVIDITNLALFDQGSVEISSEGKLIIRKISELLSEDKYRKFTIVVEGHTDDTQEIHNSYYPSNWELSGARSGSVVREMIKNKIDPHRMKAIGMADIAPAYPSHDIYGEPIPENRIKNRRVIIRIEP